MAILKRWSDGYVLNMDSRREASSVEIAVFQNHRQREQALGDTGRVALYLRALPALAAYHDGWKRIVLRAMNLELILKGGFLSREMSSLGFSQEPHADPYSVVWSRE